MTDDRIDEVVNKLRSRGIIFNERTISLPKSPDSVKIIYVKHITDITALSEEIIRPLVHFGQVTKEPPTARGIMEDTIYAGDCFIGKDDDLIQAHILSGMTVIMLSCDQSYIVVNLKKIEHRDVTTPEVTYTIRGPRDCFTENLDVNLSLIRYRLKDPNLRIDVQELGARTKTNVAVIYMQDIANDTIVSEVKKRLDRITIDSIWGTGELQAFMQNNKYDLFPQTGTTERSDWACEAIIEGKVVIMAEGGQIALIAPHVFGDSLVACDDRYDNKWFGLFSRLIRLIALFLTLSLSSIYLGLVAFHTDLLPATFTILIAQMRQHVLFPAMIEVLIVEFIVELMRESLLRVPMKIGTAVGIVGAIVIGQAATAAGIFSSFLLIIAATSLMSSFAIPDYYSAHPIRILKFFVILMTGTLGFYGFALAMTLILTNLVSINSFGVPYMAPFAPYNKYDFIRAFFFSRSFSPRRQQYLRTKNEMRTSRGDSHNHTTF